MKVFHRSDRKEMSNGELPGFFSDFCIRGPGAAHQGLAHEGPGGPISAQPMRAQGGPLGPSPLWPYT